jgi:Protein of unknown function (DUF3131).
MTEHNNKQQIWTRRPVRIALAWLTGILLATGIIYAITQTAPTPHQTGSVWNLLSSSNSASRNDTFCALAQAPDNSCLGNPQGLCSKDLEMAKVAWKYFENNYNPKTGLYNAADKYQSTTMWDTGSALAATIAAHDFWFD